MTSFEQEVDATQRWFDSPRFAGITRLYTARQVVEQRGTIARDYTVAREAADAFYDRLRQLFAQRKSITTFGPYSPGQAVTIKRMGIEGIYLGGWAIVREGRNERRPGARSRELPAQPGARRGRHVGARPAHRRPQPALPALAHDRGAARRDAGPRLPPVHHRRRRHRPRRRPARAQPDPPLRGVRRARLPPRGPAPGHQEVRPPGRQGAGRAGRAEQAAERRPLPARRHGGRRHHRRPHRRRGGQPARGPRRRARPAVPPRCHEPRSAGLQSVLPGADPALLRDGRPRAQRPSALCDPRRRARRRRPPGSSARAFCAWPRRPRRLTGTGRSLHSTPRSTGSPLPSSRRGRPRPSSSLTARRSPKCSTSGRARANRSR